MADNLLKTTEINLLKSHLPKYQLDTATLEIRQGFAYLNDSKDKEQANLLKMALAEKENQFQLLKAQSDSLDDQKKLSNQIYNELKTAISFC